MQITGRSVWNTLFLGDIDRTILEELTVVFQQDPGAGCDAVPDGPPQDSDLRKNRHYSSAGVLLKVGSDAALVDLRYLRYSCGNR
jgi:hypothetical protein